MIQIKKMAGCDFIFRRFSKPYVQFEIFSTRQTVIQSIVHYNGKITNKLDTIVNSFLQEKLEFNVDFCNQEDSLISTPSINRKCVNNEIVRAKFDVECFLN